MLFPPMVSYAQNGEDVVLRRAFAGQATGFWIDVGGCHPQLDSVTLHFSRMGWRGINVEPDVSLFATFQLERPLDINVQAAIADSSTELLFFPTGTRGHGTLVSDIAKGRAPQNAYKVPVMSLATLVDTHVPEGQTIDFLKVDVEGFESAVLLSGDWQRHRPRLVIVEAVDEHGGPSHEEWEHVLLTNGYVRALFDGLNRWYCRHDDDELLKRLEAPANVLDNWINVHHSASNYQKPTRNWLGSLFGSRR
jgi:FkbM family methyltransferase